MSIAGLQFDAKRKPDVLLTDQIRYRRGDAGDPGMPLKQLEELEKIQPRRRKPFERKLIAIGAETDKIKPDRIGRVLEQCGKN